MSVFCCTLKTLFHYYDMAENRARGTPGDAVPRPTNANNALLVVVVDTRRVHGSGGGGGGGRADGWQRGTRGGVGGVAVRVYGVLAECGLRGKTAGPQRHRADWPRANGTNIFFLYFVKNLKR